LKPPSKDSNAFLIQQKMNMNIKETALKEKNLQQTRLPEKSVSQQEKTSASGRDTFSARQNAREKNIFH